MEQKLNVTEILKNKALGTKLWSSLFGDVYFDSASANLVTVSHHKALAKFWRNAKLYDYDEAEPTLFPSKEMRNWSKFAWKKGDILVSMEGSKILFDKWANEDYTKFLGKIKVLGNSHCYDTANYSLASKEETLEFIKSVEKINNGKLNRETLEIEKPQPEFKDGDIAFADYGNIQDVFIVADKTGLTEGYSSFISLDLNSLTLSMGCRTTFFKKDLCKLRLATEAEKQQLFSALEKEGKRWDSENKAIVDLKPKCEFKPFDRCIWKIRNCEGSIWQASFVSYVDEYGASPMGMSIDEDLVNLIILPYNDKTKLLVGTTDDWKGGEQ